MTSTELSLALYMGNSQKVIEWLDSKGCKTQHDAAVILKDLSLDLISTDDKVGGVGTCFRGTVSAVQKVLDHYPKLEKE